MEYNDPSFVVFSLILKQPTKLYTNKDLFMVFLGKGMDYTSDLKVIIPKRCVKIK